jgi:hypothetical protein
LRVYDDVVRGILPSEYQIDNMLTGIEYHLRVESYPRGPYHDPMNMSQASSIPFTSPQYDQKFAAYSVLFVEEVQEAIGRNEEA